MLLIGGRRPQPEAASFRIKSATIAETLDTTVMWHTPLCREDHDLETGLDGSTDR